LAFEHDILKDQISNVEAIIRQALWKSSS